MNNFANKLAFLAVGAFACEPDYPGDYCCRVFKDQNYEGDSANLCLTEPDLRPELWFDMSIYGLENSVSSYACGSKVAYDFCKDEAGKDCGSLNGSWGAGTEYNALVGLNDQLELVKLRTYDASENAAIVVYDDINCNGASARFYATKDVNKDATYTYS